ncbi:MAG TPA: response regulator, partial [Candidatus Kapabacteria bacterium]|nr:response regulator [Candidatus Kapabacteria bacterium]
IFRPFERVRKSGANPVPGTGLGLTITRLLTDIMGGDIAVQSEPGVGSTFTVSLMLSRIDTPCEAPVVEKQIRGYLGARRLLMVVDDDPSHRGLISDLLTPLGFGVVEAACGADCLALARQCHADAFLLDVSMPGMTGWQLAESLRGNGVIAPIIMISADAREGQRDQHDADTPPRWHDDYVVKPVRLQMLLEKLGALLRLTWFYERERAESEPVPQPFLPEQLPSAEVLQELRTLAEIGYINGLKQKIQQLRQEGSATPEFIAMLQNLTSQFRFDRIIEIAQTVKP